MTRSDLVRIDEAARMLGREVDTVRRWSRRGFAPNGMKIAAVRDQVTKIRYFRRHDIERVAGALFAASA